ncbi:glycoside hydrolase family 38 C-terminal domain-containing protein [Faecalibaculum rodentium]|uniref:glycoside hydrolase family 38 N-terminal domain-containing protein n=1 Tax=Faecalibaculum rodentium TaxID=1702221 RepID=UPI002585B90A|nr:glycoside hydrolase family 38 C-terminal domain-containing protein [Faecalibaculum rodentium]
MTKKIHVIPHSHWDREWYFTTSRSKVYLMKDLQDVLETLEKQPKMRFMLDAQASLLDDYLAWRPQDGDRISNLVQKGQLVIGPWYTQTDQMVISAESIVRNLMYGIRRCSEFGPVMNVGYVPDSFGQAGNMPQIYRSFGMDSTVFWRGVCDDMVSHTDFEWEGDDGSRVLAAQIPFGYYIGGNIPESEPESSRFWEQECLKKMGHGATDNVYFPNGFDQAPVRKNLVELIEQRNAADPENTYVISTVEDYLRDVKAAAPDLEKVKGELLMAKHSRIHKSIFSSRSDLKAENTAVQNYVTNVLEPLLVISASLGNEYPKKTVEYIWKLLFENAAHDSIGSCIADTVNEDVHTRNKQAMDTALALAELHSRLIATSVAGDKNRLSWTLINPLPQKREGVRIFTTYVPSDSFGVINEKGEAVPYTILSMRDLTEYVLNQTIVLNPSDQPEKPEKVYEAVIALKYEVPALGYAQYQIADENTAALLVESDVLENEFYRISVNKNGSLDILEKQSGRLYKNQAVLEENGDDGDSFNYSPPRQDMVIRSSASQADVRIESSPLVSRAIIHLDMKVPTDLEKRSRGIADTVMPVTMTVTLKQGEPVIGFETKVENRGLSHRLCVLFDAEMKTAFNFADQQFGSICRPNRYEKEMAWYEQAAEEKTEAAAGQPVNWAQSNAWQEPPISIEPCQSYAALSKGERTVAVFPQGVREYEIVDGSVIRLTLFRTYGFMGRENLLYRPGRASGESIIETPDAQLLKTMVYSFGAAFVPAALNEARLPQLAKDFNSPVEVYEYARFLNGRLIFSQMETVGTNDRELSLLESDGNLVVSAIKQAEDSEGIVLRLYNGRHQEAVGDRVRFVRRPAHVYELNLREEKIRELPVVDGEVVVDPIGHCKFVTLLVEY